MNRVRCSRCLGRDTGPCFMCVATMEKIRRDEESEKMREAARLRAELDAVKAERDRLREALNSTANALETILAADSDMPSFDADYAEAERVLEFAREAMSEGEGPTEGA